MFTTTTLSFFGRQFTELILSNIHSVHNRETSTGNTDKELTSYSVSPDFFLKVAVL